MSVEDENKLVKINNTSHSRSSLMSRYRLHLVGPDRKIFRLVQYIVETSFMTSPRGLMSLIFGSLDGLSSIGPDTIILRRK